MSMPKVLKDIKDVRDESITATSTTLSSDTIVLTLPVEVSTGSVVKFTAPCDCNIVNSITVGGVSYSLVDTNNIKPSGSWVSGAVVSVILECSGKKAFIQGGSGGSGGSLTLDDNGVLSM